MEAKYNKIGIDYNQTRKADPYITKRLLHHLALKPDGYYLDIGCGTGNYTSQFQNYAGQFIGIDPSSKMLEIAKEKNPTIEWKLATAENTGLGTEKLDGIIASLTIHHWTDIQQAFKELYRVLKKDGKIVLFTALPKQMEQYWLQAYFPKMLQDSILQMPSFEQVNNAMQEAGFSIPQTEKYFIQTDLEDLFLYNGKHQPQRYLDPSIRNGISSFSALANQEEIAQGLQKLEKDIQSGKIQEVIQSYENEGGDYIFLIATK